jgi:serine phosphatase RsbU (regulator of sigma subunit)
MSMIGNNLLREIVVRRQITNPEQILHQMDEGVLMALNQCLNHNKDGMDLALCVVDLQQRTLEYAGAKNPLVYFRDGELILVKGSPEAIGGCVNGREKEFPVHKFSLGNNNKIYIYSDGFQDQFGSSRDRKFGNKSFRELLTSLHNLPMPDQHARLFELFEDWRGERKQIDDVLVMGLHF